MFAQRKGITNKHNFELQINNGNVLLYVHEVNFDVDKIKTSIEIVESFKIKLDEIIIKDDDCVIEKDVLEDINKEFANYVNQKYSMLKLVKDFNEKINTSITELKMPNLEKYLSSRFAFSTNQTDNMCKYCEKFIPKSMLQHYRYCFAKKDYEVKKGGDSNPDELVESSVNIVTEELPVQQIITEVSVQPIDKAKKTKKSK
jgi:hypothetical protein